MATSPLRPRLESWKEIAAYLKRTVRTVQRWEANEGLPVHRQTHLSLANVHAFPEELDAWMAKRLTQPAEALTEVPAPGRPRWWPRMLLAAVVVCALGAAVMAWMLRPREPVWLLVTALDNRAGEPLLDESVPFMLEREISNSPNVYVTPRARVDDTLTLMRKRPGTRVEEALGREVCLRDGGIRLVVSSRAEKIGSAYLLTTALSDAVTGRLLGGGSERARTIDDVAPAIRRLAPRIRRAAGERQALQSGKPERLERVTTPSLRACQLYSEAYQAGTNPRVLSGGDGWNVAARLAREAIAEDPEFASAHLWLAWSLHDSNAPEEESRAALSRALALADTASDRERQFILTSQAVLEGNHREAADALGRMVATYPDDYWARSNLVQELSQLGKWFEAAAEAYKLADSRPNDSGVAILAANRAILDGNLKQARKYKERVAQIVRASPDPSIQTWARLYFTPGFESFGWHELWAAGELEKLRARLDQRIASLKSTEYFTVHSIASHYENLGRFRDSERFLASVNFPKKEQDLIGLAFLRDDPAVLGPTLLKSSPPDAGVAAFPTYLSQMFSMRADETQEALQTQLVGFPPALAFKPLFESRIAALAGDPEMAARRFDEFFGRDSGSKYFPQSLIGKAILARAYEKTGNDAKALGALQAIDRGRAPCFEQVGISSGAFWQRVRYDEARLLRKLGRAVEADVIETDLRRDLRLADPDHPILVRLNQPDRKPFSVY